MSQSTAINPLRARNEEFKQAEREIQLGGGPKAIDRQHAKGRLTARERIEKLLDDPTGFIELGLWCAHGMYREYGGAPSAGVVTGVGTVEGRACMIVANDATVKAGAFFPMTCKKIIRAQTIAQMARLPLIYLVDSAGVFLPLQEDVFPDTDDFDAISTALIGTGDLVDELWATGVAQWTISLDEVDPLDAGLVSFQLTLDAGGLTDTSVNAVSLRD